MKCLSQVLLPVSTALKAGLADGYAWHCAIWDSFPGQPDAERAFLFRVDRSDDSFRVLLLSSLQPAASGVLEWKTKEITPAFLSRDIYRFQLKANPTMRRAKDKRRLAIYDEARLRAWIKRKANAAGFEIESGSLEAGAPVAETFVKHGKTGKHVAVDYRGLLRVSDRDAFSHAFNNGIGSAKGFGYGMLMLQPVG